MGHKKEVFKKTGEELQLYLHFKKRNFAIPPKKGKGSFDRKKSRSQKVDF